MKFVRPRSTADFLLGLLILGLLLHLIAASAVGYFALRAQDATAHPADWRAWAYGGIFVTAVLFSWIVRSAIRRAAQVPIDLATSVVEEVAAGDLTVSANGMDQVHTRRLMKALQAMTSMLHLIVAQVVAAARNVASATRQLAEDNRELARRTEKEASALQQTASSLEQITSTVMNNAESARLASEFAVAAKGVAQSGGEVIERVAGTMAEISQFARRISEITGAIDSIAFQTNILALNAAVEAARAGDEGRGFAVVAAEVRQLSLRSAEAARSIRILIQESVEKVQDGALLVDSAGQTMAEIVGSVAAVCDRVADIAAASAEQSHGIAELNAAIAQMDRTMQQNAAMVDRAKEATQAMDEQAANLLGLVSHFRVHRAGESGPAAKTSQLVASPTSRRSAPRLQDEALAELH